MCLPCKADTVETQGAGSDLKPTQDAEAALACAPAHSSRPGNMCMQQASHDKSCAGPAGRRQDRELEQQQRWVVHGGPRGPGLRSICV